MRPDFVRLCESTRAEGAHIQLFTTFTTGKNFVHTDFPTHYVQPFQHSVGVLYLNLQFDSSEKMYCSHPWPSFEYKLLSCSNELKTLWDGVLFHVPGETSDKLFRGALIGVACDLPACRKVCGFLGHCANLGCSKCLVEFSEGFNKQNYSNFNKQTWKLRIESGHRADVKKIAKSKHKTENRNGKARIKIWMSIFLTYPILILYVCILLYLGTAWH